MREDWTSSFRFNGKAFLVAGLLVTALLVIATVSDGTMAQKAQENYRDKFNIADTQGGVAVACSSDGQHVYVAGPQGVIVSNDFGRTGTWVQTVRLK
jgi:hypothetical protein